MMVFHDMMFDFNILGMDRTRLHQYIWFQVTKMPKGLHAYQKVVNGEKCYCFSFFDFVLCFRCKDFIEHGFTDNFILIKCPNDDFYRPYINFNNEFVAIVDKDLFKKIYRYKNTTRKDMKTWEKSLENDENSEKIF